MTVKLLRLLNILITGILFAYTANSTALEFCSRCLSSGCINVNGSTWCDCPPGFELLTPESTMCVGKWIYML